MLTRVREGYAPGGSSDLVFLKRDLDMLRSFGEGSDLDGFEDRLRLASECEAEARRLGIPDVVAQVLVARVGVLRRAGRHREVIPALCSAEREIADLDARYDHLRVAISSGLAEAYAADGRWDLVSKACETGIGIVETHRAHVSGQYLQSSYLRSSIRLYRLGVEAAWHAKCPDLMLARAELAKCRSVLRQRSGPGAQATEGAAKVEKDFQEVCRQIHAARLKGSNELAIAHLRAKRRALWDLLLIERAQSEGELPLPDFDLAELQASLDPDEAVLYYYWIDRTNLLVVFIDDRTFACERSTLTGDEARTFKEFCAGILDEANTDLLRSSSYLDQLDVFARLLLPDAIRQRMTRRHQRLLISPHQLLHALPFHALPWCCERTYLIERFAVTYVPNLRSLSIRYEPPNGHSLLLAGIDDYGERSDGEGGKVSNILDAEAEVLELEKLYRAEGWDVRPLRGAEASRQAWHKLEKGPGTSTSTRLHLAMHGRNVSSDTPMESHLELFDSRLEGLEVANQRLGADLVVLSACCSGQRSIRGRGMEELPGDDLFGLQAAFFAAGARRIVCSLWAVEPPMVDMLALHRGVLAGQRPECALQDAIISYLERQRADRQRQPLNARYFWAPFFLSAVGRPSSAEGQR